MQFLATIQGGDGPDVWDKECFIDAADFMDAAGLAAAKADEFCGQVTRIDQCDCSEDAALDRAVSRFLAWPLPKDFSPDCGISFIENRSPHCWPVGTNLFTATQARQMIRRALGWE